MGNYERRKGWTAPYSVTPSWQRKATNPGRPGGGGSLHTITLVMWSAKALCHQTGAFRESEQKLGNREGSKPLEMAHLSDPTTIRNADTNTVSRRFRLTP